MDVTFDSQAWALYGCPPAYTGDWYYVPQGTVYYYFSGTEIQKYTKTQYNGKWDRIVYDYLGSCTPQEPAHCSNGVLDGDETGYDCGGSCNSVCDSEGCPPGTSYFYGNGCFPDNPDWTISQDAYGACAQGTVNISQDPSVKICVPYGIVPDSAGNCQEGLEIAYQMGGGQELCGPAIVNYSSDDTPPEMQEYSMEQPTYEKGSLSIVKYETPEDIVNNGDGTSTGTRTTEERDQDGNLLGSTTIATNYSGENGTGEITGVSTTTATTIAAEENPENYNYQLEQPDYGGVEVTENDVPEKKSITALVQGLIDNNPVATTIRNSGVELESETTELTWTYPATGQVITFDLSDRNDVLATIGGILVFLAGISAYFIIVGRE